MQFLPLGSLGTLVFDTNFHVAVYPGDQSERDPQMRLGWVKMAISGVFATISRKRWKIWPRLPVTADRKSNAAYR